MMKRIKLSSKQRVELILAIIMTGLMGLVFSQLAMKGVTSFGDWYYPNPGRTLTNFNWPHVIRDYSQIGFYGGLFSYRLLLESIFGFLVNLGLSHILLTNLFYLLPGPILAAVGMWLLAKELNNHPVSSFLASLLYTFNSYPMLLFSGGHIPISVAYGLVPWIILFVRRLLLRPNVRHLATLVLLVSLESAYDPRIVYITAITIMVISIGEFGRQLFNRQRLKWIGLFVLWFVIINAYWIYPSFFISGGASYLAGSQDGYWIGALSYATFWHAITLHHVWWPGTLGLGPQHAPYLFFYFIPLIAVAGYLAQRKSGRIWGALLITGLVGAFLTKGSNPPLGELYLWLFKHVFGFNAYRDPSKFFIMVAPAVALLFGVGSVRLWQWACQRRLITLKIALIATIGTIFVFGYSQVWLRQLGGNFVKYQSSNQINAKLAELNKQDPWYRVLWVPMHYRFVLHDADHPSIDGSDTLMQKTVWQNIPYLQDWLSSYGATRVPNLPYVLSGLGIKYFALAGDSISDLYGVSFLTTQARYRQVIDRLDIFKERIDVVDSQGATSNLFTYPNALGLFYTSDGLAVIDNNHQFELLRVDSPADYAVAVNNQPGILAETDGSFSLKTARWDLDADGTLRARVDNVNSAPSLRLGLLPPAFSVPDGQISELADVPINTDAGTVSAVLAPASAGTIPIRYAEDFGVDYLASDHISDWRPCRALSEADQLATISEQAPNHLTLTSKNGLSSCVELTIPNQGAGQWLVQVAGSSHHPEADLDVDFIGKGNQHVAFGTAQLTRSIVDMANPDYEQIRLRLYLPAVIKEDATLQSIRLQKLSDLAGLFAVRKLDNLFATQAKVDYAKTDAETYQLSVNNSDKLPVLLNFSLAYHEGWELVHRQTGRVVNKHFASILNTNVWVVDADLTGDFDLTFKPIRPIRIVSYLSLAAILGSLITAVYIFTRPKNKQSR